MKEELRIGLIEPYATKDGTLWGPRMKDLYSMVRLPSRAIDLLAAILRNRGFSSVKTFNPLYNRHRGRFHREELSALAKMDVVGISSITRTQPPAYELARRLKKLNPGVWTVFGGPHVTALPEESLEHGDVVVRREGDATFVDLLERLAEGRSDPFLEDLPGISYRHRDGSIRHNPERPFLTSEELSELPFPDLPHCVLRGISNSVIVTSRGCPFACEFCAVISQFGRGYRFLDTDRAVELIEHTLRQTRKPVFFGDDNFNARPSRTRAILERVLEKGIRMPPWGAQVRVEAAQDRALLALMKRAGCSKVYVGFESINQETLDLFNKRSSREENEAAIRAFHKAGLSIHGMFVLGSDADTLATVRDTVAFAKEMRLGTAQFFALTTLPGTPMTARYLEEGKVLNRNWHLYDAHHVVIEPARMTPHLLQQEITRSHKDFYSWREALRNLFSAPADRLYNAKIRILGSFLTLWIHRQVRTYRRQLRTLEAWSQEVENRYQSLWRAWGSRVQTLGREISQTTEPVRESAEEFMGWLRKSLEPLPQEFLPYCRRYVRPKIETIRKLLVSGECQPAPLPLSSSLS
jgi:anaerobic magnesium-protoporphyrin IX monomethyl ester cyclase